MLQGSSETPRNILLKWLPYKENLPLILTQFKLSRLNEVFLKISWLTIIYFSVENKRGSYLFIYFTSKQKKTTNKVKRTRMKIKQTWSFHFNCSKSTTNRVKHIFRHMDKLRDLGFHTWVVYIKASFQNLLNKI